jgi:hypothetical protein
MVLSGHFTLRVILSKSRIVHRAVEWGLVVAVIACVAALMLR